MPITAQSLVETVMDATRGRGVDIVLNSLTGAQKQAYSFADFIFGAPSHYELNNNPVAHLRQRCTVAESHSRPFSSNMEL